MMKKEMNAKRMDEGRGWRLEAWFSGLMLAVALLSGCGRDSGGSVGASAPGGDELPAAGHVHDPANASEPGPNGGRMVRVVEPGFEFLLEADRRARVTFVGTDGEPVEPPEGVQLRIVAGERSEPRRIGFETDGGRLVSVDPLPEGDSIPVVLEVRTEGVAEPVYERFYLNLATCPDCSLPEYACVCGH